MMLNKLAAPLPQVLDFVGANTKWGVRNRALYACRQCLQIKHIANLSVADVLNQDGTVKDFYVASDGRQFELSPIKSEIIRYLTARFCLVDRSLEPLSTMNLNVPLFPTQKRDNFTPNTLAQNLSLTDRLVNRHFFAKEAKIKLFTY